MKNYLLYIVGSACLLYSMGTFTSCINGVDDEYLELANQGSSDNSGSNQKSELVDLNGDYYAGGDLQLKLTYNGEELTEKKVTVAADEKNETATFTLAGTDQDLSSLLGGLMDFKYTSYSPIPGQKEVTLTNVNLYANGNTYIFGGEVIQPTYTMKYEGKIEDETMTLNIKHELVNQELAGTWNLASKVSTGQAPAFSPLWVDWDSDVSINLGKVSILTIDQSFNSIFSLVCGALSSIVMNAIIGQSIAAEDIVRNLLQSVTAQPDGCMYATYSYSGDLQNPEWSSDMSHNVLRYYYGEEPGKIYLDVNADYLLSLIGGLLNPTGVTRAADPEATKQLGRELIALLVPILQQGIPCDYVLDGDNLTVNIDGVVMRDILRKLMELANDEYASTFVQEFLNSSLGDFSSNIQSMLETMPNALKYHDYDSTTGEYSGECAYVKVGLKFVKE